MYNGTMNKAHFLIAFTQPVTFKDMNGTVLKAYQPGDVVVATADAGAHFVTAMGGIYKDEARKVDGEELITYANGAQLDRYRQYAKDPVPVWGTDIRLEMK